MDLHAVIINGAGTHGKDEFIFQVSGTVEKNPELIVVNYSTIDSIKQICHGNWGVDPREKTGKARQLWSDIKDALIAYDDLPAKEAIAYTSSIKNTLSRNVILFIHCREPEETHKIKEGISPICASVTTLVIIRPGHTVPDCTKDDMLRILNFEYDEVIAVRTKEELRAKAVDFTRELLTKHKEVEGNEQETVNSGPKVENETLEEWLLHVI